MEPDRSLAPPQPPRRAGPVWLFIAAALLLAVAAAWWWWPKPALPPASTQPLVQAAEPQPAAPAIKYPLIDETVVDSGAAAAASVPSLGSAMADMLARDLGREAVLRFLQTDEFVRRVVVTVDNLDRAHAAARLWPVNPTPGRFSVTGQAGQRFVGADNAARYAPLVQWATALDSARIVALYRRLYPQLQQAYVELGYPKGYFNDRVVEIIDHLLAAPEPAGVLAVQLTEVKGPIAPVAPWTRYEFAEAQYESLSAGQKIMLRVGPIHERQLKNKLTDLRGRLIGAAQNKAR